MCFLIFLDTKGRNRPISVSFNALQMTKKKKERKSGFFSSYDLRFSDFFFSPVY